MTECNAIIKANNEINKLKEENKKLNALCVEYGFKMGRLDEENEQLKQSIDYHLNVCKNEKKKITDLYNWGIPQRHSKSVSSELVLKYIGAIEVLEQIKKELKGDLND